MTATLLVVGTVILATLGLLVLGARHITRERNEQRAALSDVERIMDASSKKEGGPPA